MEWMIAALAVLVLGVAAFASTGAMGAMAPADDDTFVPAALPEDDLAGDDLRDVTFGVQPRGYDMAQVDAVMARTADELDRREAAEPVLDAVPARAIGHTADGDPVEDETDVWNNGHDQDEEK